MILIRYGMCLWPCMTYREGIANKKVTSERQMFLLKLFCLEPELPLHQLSAMLLVFVLCPLATLLLKTGAPRHYNIINANQSSLEQPTQQGKKATMKQTTKFALLENVKMYVDCR